MLAMLRREEVYIQTHNYPDPDAMASAFALQYWLQCHGIETKICFFGTVEKVNIRLMMECLDIQCMERSEMNKISEQAVVITVDCQKYNTNLTDMRGEERICIDHHPWVTHQNYDIVIHKITGACATIITELYLESETPIPKNIATALLYGLKMDTRNFCSGVTEADIEAFAILHQLADNEMIQKLDNSTLELSDLHAYGAAIQNIRVYESVGFVNIPFDCSDGLIASVSNFILSLDAVEVTVVYANRGGGLKFSVRSEREDVNAGTLIEEALRDIGGGGGHATMAGGVVTREVCEILSNRVEDEIQRRFMQVYLDMTTQNTKEYGEYGEYGE